MIVIIAQKMGESNSTGGKPTIKVNQQKIDIKINNRSAI